MSETAIDNSAAEAADGKIGFAGVSDNGGQGEESTSTQTSTAATPEPTPEQLAKTSPLPDKLPNFSEFKTRGEEPPKPVVEKEKKEEATADLTEQEKNQQQPEVTLQQKPGARDYSGIAAEHIPFFKKTSNEAFSFLKPIYLEKQKLENEIKTLKSQPRQDGLPANYYEHPEAYVLSPEYKSQSMMASVAQQLEDHWINQLANVEEGGQWTDVDIDQKTGKLVFGKPQDTTAEARVYIRRSLSVTQKQNATEQGKLVGLQQGFKEKRAKSTATLKEFENKFFPGMDDEKHPTKALQKQIIDQYPEEFRDHPTTSLLAKTAASLAQSQGLLRDALKKIEILEGKKKDAAKAQPTGREFQGGNGKLTSGVKFSDFKNRD